MFTRALLLVVLTQPAPLPSTPPTGTANPGVVSPRPPARIVSPEVAPDRRVTFRLRAPRATEVQVRGLFFRDRVPLTRDAQGVWTATVDPVEPGIYEYNFWVDGLALVDPANPAIQPAREPEVSILEVPGSPALLTEAQDVPHGTVHAHHYRARALEGRPRRLQVYTPPGYETGRGGRLPVLYLLHGSGDNDATWSVYGRAGFILDNLLASRKVAPMVVVMPDGHPVPRGQTGGRDNTAAFIDELLTDILPLVERTYRVRTDPAGRAIAGLSMGGRQALTVGLNHPDRFAWVGAMSAAIPPEEAIAPALAGGAAVSRKLRWLWIACGREDGLFPRNEAFVALLAQKGIAPKWHPTDGGHRWPVWRGYLAEIAPQLFRAAASAARPAPQSARR
jgi:enterochelin esterase family protein